MLYPLAASSSFASVRYRHPHKGVAHTGGPSRILILCAKTCHAYHNAVAETALRRYASRGSGWLT